MLERFPALDYDPELLERAMQPMRMGAAGWRTQVAASLAPVLSAAHRALLAPFEAPTSPGRDSSGSPTCDERLLEIGLGRYVWATPWVRACALRLLDPSSPGAAEALGQASAESDPCIADVATEVLAGSSRGAGLDRGAITVGPRTVLAKVTVLREVTLFRAIPHEDLLGVARLLTDHCVLPGEQLFAKGDFGDRLYVIASGRVRVHDGDRTLGLLGPNECFGELSLLDAEPRAASATALETTDLFSLDQADFYAVIAERPEIVRSVNRSLGQMLRAMVESDAREADRGERPPADRGVVRAAPSMDRSGRVV